MPSIAHETLVDLFKNRLSLAAEILVEVLGLSLPDYTEARIASADLTEIQPAEYRADIVVLLLHDGAPVRVVIVEVQLAADPQKRLSWPAYVTVARAVRRALEKKMKGYEYQSDFAKKYVAQGLTEGIIKGRTEEAARAVLTVLKARGLAVPEAARELILSQKDTERLERWLEKAAVAPSVAAVLDDPS